MSAIPKPNWDAFECPHCDEPFTREQWIDPDAIHFEGVNAMHSHCCDSPSCLHGEIEETMGEVR